MESTPKGQDPARASRERYSSRQSQELSEALGEDLRLDESMNTPRDGGKVREKSRANDWEQHVQGGDVGRASQRGPDRMDSKRSRGTSIRTAKNFKEDDVVRPSLDTEGNSLRSKGNIFGMKSSKRADGAGGLGEGALPERDAIKREKLQQQEQQERSFENRCIEIMKK